MDTLFVGLRVVVSLGAVLAVIWYAHRRITKGQSLTKSARPITIVGRQSLSQKSSVVIIEADGKRLLLGVTDSTITVLSETEARTAHIPDEMSSVDRISADHMHGDGMPLGTNPRDRSTIDPSTLGERAFARHLAAAAAQSTNTPTNPLNTSAGTRAAAPATPPPLPAPHGLLRGSILSAETWKLSFAALRQGPRQ